MPRPVFNVMGKVNAVQIPRPQGRPSRFFPFGSTQGFGSITATFAQNDTKTKD
jgi:hypothetical protein